ncbi:hypothetical protein Tco_1131099 [Tanacetum coccineum]
MEPYYIKCIKDGHFQPKTVESANKLESQWSNDERRVVNQDQRLKSIIISCLPDDIMESVMSCEIAKATWTNLVHSFEGSNSSSVSSGFQPKFTQKLIQSSQQDQSSQNEPEIQKDYKIKYQKDEEEVSDDGEMTQVKVLMDLVNDELSVGNNHARNGE